MRIDESSLPKGRSVKVRCPHCNEIGPTQDPVSFTGAVDGRLDSSTQPFDETMDDLRRALPRDKSPLFPSSVASDFRFSAEREAISPRKTILSRRLKVLLWAVGSLLVVGFFALLVNIILPGPYGAGSDTGAPPEEEAFTRPVEKPRPSQLEKDAGRSPTRR